MTPIYSVHPWRCAHHSDRSEVMAYVEASGTWETVLTVNPISEASAEAIATFITGLVNSYQQNRDLLRNAMAALEAVMQDGLTFATEQEADSVVAGIKRVIS